MTYDELVMAYPSIDVFLELFKGIAPTLVALLAIVVNNNKAKNRDKKSRKDALLYNVKKEMLEKFIELSRLQWKCGADLIDYLSELEEEKKHVFAESYTNSLYNSLYKAQEISDYYHTMFEALKIDINCSEVVGKSRNYSDSLNDLCEEYLNTYKIGCMKERNKQLDIMRDKTLVKTGEVKEWTNKIMKDIANSFENK